MDLPLEKLIKFFYRSIKMKKMASLMTIKLTTHSLRSSQRADVRELFIDILTDLPVDSNEKVSSLNTFFFS